MQGCGEPEPAGDGPGSSIANGRRRRRRWRRQGAQAPVAPGGAAGLEGRHARATCSGQRPLPRFRCTQEGCPRSAPALHVPGVLPVLDRLPQRRWGPTKCAKRRLRLGILRGAVARASAFAQRRSPGAVQRGPQSLNCPKTQPPAQVPAGLAGLVACALQRAPETAPL